MFLGAKLFNQPLGSWNTSKVMSMGCMFLGAKNFNQSLENWNISNVKYVILMFLETDSMLRTFPNLKETPDTSNWKKNFNRAKPTKGARH